MDIYEKVEQLGSLSTNEVMALSGLSRKQLDSYIEKGIVTPARRGSGMRAEIRWTFEQLFMARHVPVLIRSGLSLEEIAKLANQGTQAVNACLKAQYMREMRTGRRGLKDIIARDEEIINSMGANLCKEQYLRYIPQRWMALIPVPSEERTPRSKMFASHYTDLITAANVFGWSIVDTAGTLISLSASEQESSSYLFTELASPPTPRFTGHRIIDGGCYYAVNNECGGPDCNGTRCAECARFGRNPTGSEIFNWTTQERTNPELWDHTVMLSDLDGPYPTGMWSEFTKEHFSIKDQINFDNDKSETTQSTIRQKSATVRPRLMPHIVKLPLGITACVLPAGVYLCYQCDEGMQESSFQRMLGLTAAITHQPFTTEDEITASLNSCIQMERDKPSMTAPVAEPFALSRAAGDPRMAGWFQETNQADLHKLILPTNMALAPEDGYCIVCSTMPVQDRNDPVRYETQLLVDATNIIPSEMLEES